MKKLLFISLIALFAVVSVDAQRYFSKSLKDRVLADRPTFTACIGTGLAGDTTELSADAEYGMVMWDGANTFEVTNFNVAIQSGIGDDTLAVQMCWSDTIADATPYVLNTTALAVDSTNASIPGGLDDTSFDDATIPSGYYVWFRLSGLTEANMPKQVVITVTGHEQDENGN